MEELMKLKKRNIIISENSSIEIYEQTLFKANGEEGLHLWETAVLLSRYIQKNPEMFSGKTIIELGTGCGLLGMTLLQYTTCEHLTFSDYQESVLNNLIVNLSLNKQNHRHIEDGSNMSIPICLGCHPGRYSILNLDWRDYEKYQFNSFDFVIGSELIYDGGYIEELSKLIKNLLKPDGRALIAMPKKRSMTNKFLGFLTDNNLNYTFSEIKDDTDSLFDAVLGDVNESKKLFEDLKKMNIILYEIYN